MPGSSTRDTRICSELGNDGGIVAVDMEDESNNSASAMANFGAVFRSTNPSTPIIVSGYGDPITRFGGTWPNPQLTYWADASGPQWYYGEWSEYANYGVDTAINWADAQCGQVCGSSFPMSPELSIYTIYQRSGILPDGDIAAGGNYAKDWKAPVFWREYGNMNATLAYYCPGR